MNRTYILALLCGMSLTAKLQAFDDEFFKDIDESFQKMNKRMTSFFEKESLDATLDHMQSTINNMRDQFEKMHENFVQNSASDKTSPARTHTIQDEDTIIKITIDVGTIEPDTIENHIDHDALVITAPADKPSLKITIYPDMLVMDGKKVEEKQGTDKDSLSHFVSSSSFHIQQKLSSLVIPTQNVSITHDNETKTLIIELPKKTDCQKFSIKKK